jgi:hypothetical protein
MRAEGGSMNQTMKITKREAAPFMDAAGIEYNGRKFTVEFTRTVTFWDTNWGGGTRNEYHLLNMDTSCGKRVCVPAPWINPVEGQTIELPSNGLVLVHKIFCGHDLGITIFAHPDNVPKLLMEGE